MMLGWIVKKVPADVMSKVRTLPPRFTVALGSSMLDAVLLTVIPEE